MLVLSALDIVHENAFGLTSRWPIWVSQANWQDMGLMKVMTNETR